MAVIKYKDTSGVTRELPLVAPMDTAMSSVSTNGVQNKVITQTVGDLSSLATTTKTNLVAAINETFTSVSNGKATVASAVTDKGVPTASDATFATIATNIRAIPTGITPTGNIELQQRTGTDVTNYATASVKTGTATTPATTKQQSSPTFSLSGTTLTASVAATSVSVTPTVSAGWVSTGSAGTITMSANSANYTIPTETKTATVNGDVTPTSGKFLSKVTVNVPYKTYRTGTGAPSSSLGNDGDIYIDLS